MNKLRSLIVETLKEIKASRPAALRRSAHGRCLYATDLPQVTNPEGIDTFRDRMEKAGWRTEVKESWIELDFTGAVPRDVDFTGPFGKEAECCASLLRRHPEGRTSGDLEKRKLLKAGECGAKAYEKECLSLHREWAEKLRKGEALPDIHLTFFEGEEE